MNIGEFRLLMTELERVERGIDTLTQISREARLSDDQKSDLECQQHRRTEILAMEISK